MPRGTETILLAEDEQDVREVAREFLESGGYTVIEAHNGAEALRLATEHKASIDLLVTDMVMPGHDWQRVGAAIAASDIRESASSTCLVTARQTAAESAQADADMLLLTKPFSRGSILRAVREALNVSRAALAFAACPLGCWACHQESLWMFAMPVGVKLEGSRRLNHGEVVARTSHELQSNGKIIFGEAAGNGQGRKSAEIADGAERIRECEIGLQIGFQRSRGNGLSGERPARQTCQTELPSFSAKSPGC